MHKKPRLPRIERSEHDGIEDETAHLWAVSYSDFLMVLLSFFILFFSVDKDKKESVIQRLLATSLEEGEGSGRRPSYMATGPEVKSDKKDRFSSSAIRSALTGLEIKRLEDQETLMLLFPDNLYPSLGMDLSGKHLAQFETILLRLKPFMDEIEITIVGHSDKRALTSRSATEILQNNFDLSVMRAAKALQRALSLGLKAEILSAKGAAANERDARSISLVIRPINKK